MTAKPTSISKRWLDEERRWIANSHLLEAKSKILSGNNYGALAHLDAAFNVLNRATDWLEAHRADVLAGVEFE